MGKFEKIIVEITEDILGIKASSQKTFEWLINSHIEVEDKWIKKILNDIFITLNGDLDGLVSKRRSKLCADAYLDSLNLILEIDEIQHFTKYRMQTLEILKNNEDIKLGYNIENYINNCIEITM